MLGRFIRIVTLAWLIAFAMSPVYSQVTADKIFSDLEKSVFQIKIIEQKSGSQSALGTGFLVASNRLATNYHVISMAVMEPSRYRIQLEDGEQQLQVVTVDVVNDLAILNIPEEQTGIPFSLAEEAPKHGTLIYSLGNPHNLGMTIVQGNYNGLVEHNFFDRIHYSGAINPGMSGGPAVDEQYQVVGVNVASAGNQVGFLVPVAALRLLLQKSLSLQENYVLLDDMAKQIASATDAMLDDVLAAEWPVEQMGEVSILGKTVSWFDCWGNSKDDKEEGRLEISRGCNNADNIFLSHHFNTGYFEYEYYYFEAPDWPAAAFYRYMRGTTSAAVPGNQAGKDDVANFSCNNSHIRTGEGNQSIKRRVSYCVRPYKKLKGLFDVFFIGVTEDRDNQSAMDHFTLSGVTAESAQRFLEKFVGVLTWR